MCIKKIYSFSFGAGFKAVPEKKQSQELRPEGSNSCAIINKNAFLVVGV
ncbi:MAG: hypothetical protein KDD19_26090 [Phaeodactylibacter sp.]|nr:hypothetical protein [Phaeodactylibacter sp.]